MFMITACEEIELQKSQQKIEARDHCIDDCNDCPVDDCCCVIEALSGNLVNLTWCGVSDPCVSSTPCSGSAGGCNISGSEFYGTINYGAADYTELFCVPKGRAFYVQPGIGQTGTARMTCQLGQANPTYVNITWNGNKVYYSTGNDCSLTSCL